MIELLEIPLAYNARSIFDSSMPRVELLGIPLASNARSTFDSSMPRVEFLGIPLAYKARSIFHSSMSKGIQACHNFTRKKNKILPETISIRCAYFIRFRKHFSDLFSTITDLAICILLSKKKHDR